FSLRSSPLATVLQLGGPLESSALGQPPTSSHESKEGGAGEASRPSVGAQSPGEAGAGDTPVHSPSLRLEHRVEQPLPCILIWAGQPSRCGQAPSGALAKIRHLVLD